jgi:hypothetical protein
MLKGGLRGRARVCMCRRKGHRARPVPVTTTPIVISPNEAPPGLVHHLQQARDVVVLQLHETPHLRHHTLCVVGGPKLGLGQRPFTAKPCTGGGRGGHAAVHKRKARPPHTRTASWVQAAAERGQEKHPPFSPRGTPPHTEQDYISPHDHTYGKLTTNTTHNEKHTNKQTKKNTQTNKQTKHQTRRHHSTSQRHKAAPH